MNNLNSQQSWEDYQFIVEIAIICWDAFEWGDGYRKQLMRRIDGLLDKYPEEDLDRLQDIFKCYILGSENKERYLQVLEEVFCLIEMEYK